MDFFHFISWPPSLQRIATERSHPGGFNQAVQKMCQFSFGLETNRKWFPSSLVCGVCVCVSLTMQVDKVFNSEESWRKSKSQMCDVFSCSFVCVFLCVKCCGWCILLTLRSARSLVRGQRSFSESRSHILNLDVDLLSAVPTGTEAGKFKVVSQVRKEIAFFKRKTFELNKVSSSLAICNTVYIFTHQSSQKLTRDLSLTLTKLLNCHFKVNKSRTTHDRLCSVTMAAAFMLVSVQYTSHLALVSAVCSIRHFLSALVSAVCRLPWSFVQ